MYLLVGTCLFQSWRTFLFVYKAINTKKIGSFKSMRFLKMIRISPSGGCFMQLGFPGRFSFTIFVLSDWGRGRFVRESRVSSTLYPQTCSDCYEEINSDFSQISKLGLHIFFAVIYKEKIGGFMRYYVGFSIQFSSFLSQNVGEI